RSVAVTRGSWPAVFAAPSSSRVVVPEDMPMSRMSPSAPSTFAISCRTAASISRKRPGWVRLNVALPVFSHVKKRASSCAVIRSGEIEKNWLAVCTRHHPDLSCLPPPPGGALPTPGLSSSSTPRPVARGLPPLPHSNRPADGYDRMAWAGWDGRNLMAGDQHHGCSTARGTGRGEHRAAGCVPERADIAIWPRGPGYPRPVCADHDIRSAAGRGILPFRLDPVFPREPLPANQFQPFSQFADPAAHALRIDGHGPLSSWRTPGHLCGVAGQPAGIMAVRPTVPARHRPNRTAGGAAAAQP